MLSSDLLEQLCVWIESFYHQPEATPGLHCFRVFRSVPLPDGGVISAVSIRHQAPRAARAPDLFVAELWNLRQGPIQSGDIKEMCLALASFRAWYAEILEAAEVEGLRRRHRFSVHGNLVGASVESVATIDLLTHHGGEVAFWTYVGNEAGAEFEPYYRGGHRTTESVLVPMLNHLSWEAPQDQDSGSDAQTNNPVQTRMVPGAP